MIFQKLSWRSSFLPLVKNLLQNLDSDVNRFFGGEASMGKLNRKLNLHEARQQTVRTVQVATSHLLNQRPSTPVTDQESLTEEGLALVTVIKEGRILLELYNRLQQVRQIYDRRSPQDYVLRPVCDGVHNVGNVMVCTMLHYNDNYQCIHITLHLEAYITLLTRLPQRVGNTCRKAFLSV